MNYTIDHTEGFTDLIIKPDYTASDGRYNHQLGEAALHSGHFKVALFDFTKEGVLVQRLYEPEVNNPAVIAELVTQAQNEIQTIMDELLRWRDIAEIVKESRKPQKEG